MKVLKWRKAREKGFWETYYYTGRLLGCVLSVNVYTPTFDRTPKGYWFSVSRMFPKPGTEQYFYNSLWKSDPDEPKGIWATPEEAQAAAEKFTIEKFGAGKIKPGANIQQTGKGGDDDG